MTKFVVTQIYHVPPAVLAQWWLDYREDDVQYEADLKSRKVVRIDATHIHLINEMMRGRRHVHLDGVVTITDSTRWSFNSDITVDGRPFAREVITFRVEPEGTDKSRLVAAFDWAPKSFLARIALPLMKGSLRGERETVYAGYASAIEGELRAH